MINNKKRAGTFYIGGSEWYDERSIRNKETLFAPGPILTDIGLCHIRMKNHELPLVRTYRK